MLATEREWANAKSLDLERIYDAAGGLCGVCDRPVAFGDAEWDHIIPRSAGGRTVESNIQPSHRACNFFKLDRPLEWARENIAAHLARTPNEVERLIAENGGMMKAAIVANVRVATLFDWKKLGSIRLLDAAMALIEAVEPDPVACWRRLLKVRPARD